jgi:nucleoside 2-deoxyribosyltransferase
LSDGTQLISYVFSGWAADVRASMCAFGVTAVLTEIPLDIGFRYVHPLAQPTLEPDVVPPHKALDACAEVVLRFGFIEGDAVVQAKRAIYDPQGTADLTSFRENGSTADALAVVLNEEQLHAASRTSDIESGARCVLGEWSADVVVVKAGIRGAFVVEPSAAIVTIPAYWSERVFKIGSGDVFSAVFAYHWGERHVPASVAADIASRAVSAYVEDRCLPVPSQSVLAGRHPIPIATQSGRIYLAGPFFDVAQRWRIEETRDCLNALGAKVFSPLHEVGVSNDEVYIATSDLDGLKQCTAVLAVLDGNDPGTLFEVGFARALGIPVVVLAESASTRSDLTMFRGSGCEIVDDFASALYRAAWAAQR